MASSSSSSTTTTTTTPLLSSPPSSSTSTTTTPLLSSPPSSIADLQQWLPRINSTFHNYLLLDTHRPISIFTLPQTLISQKPDSFLPQHIGLGPIHHFQTNLYSKQQQLKLTTAKTLLQTFNITSQFDETVIETLKKVIPQTRFRYDSYFDVKDDVLAWIFALDGLFLFDVLSKTSVEDSIECFEDVMKLENQIPLVILIELRKVLDKQPSNESNNSTVANLLFSFCEARSPFKLSTWITEVDLVKIGPFDHLLGCMYFSIVSHNLAPQNQFLRTHMLDICLEDVNNAVEMASELFPGANVFLKPIKLLLKLPWNKIVAWIKKPFEENVTIIPSASKLSRVGKIEFCTNDGGIRDIEFDEEKQTFCLPVLSLKPDSEVILRNLMVYEGLMFEKRSLSILDFTAYVGLMCGIIDGANDVKILREKNIIEGELCDEEIAKIFNGIGQSSVKSDMIVHSMLEKPIKKVNEYYGNRPSVKAFGFVKKAFLASWKVFAIVFAIVNFVLLILVGVCRVYECHGHFGLGNARLVFRYVFEKNEVVGF